MNISEFLYQLLEDIILVPKQTDRPMKQNRDHRNKPRHLINLRRREQEYKMGKRQSPQ